MSRPCVSQPEFLGLSECLISRPGPRRGDHGETQEHGPWPLRPPEVAPGGGGAREDREAPRPPRTLRPASGSPGLQRHALLPRQLPHAAVRCSRTGAKLVGPGGRGVGGDGPRPLCWGPTLTALRPPGLPEAASLHPADAAPNQVRRERPPAAPRAGRPLLLPRPPLPRAPHWRLPHWPLLAPRLRLSLSSYYRPGGSNPLSPGPQRPTVAFKGLNVI